MCTCTSTFVHVYVYVACLSTIHHIVYGLRCYMHLYTIDVWRLRNIIDRHLKLYSRCLMFMYVSITQNRVYRLPSCLVLHNLAWLTRYLLYVSVDVHQVLFVYYLCLWSASFCRCNVGGVSKWSRMEPTLCSKRPKWRQHRTNGAKFVSKATHLEANTN